MVGLIPLFAVETLESELVDTLPSFKTAPAVVHRAPARVRRLHRDAHDRDEHPAFLSLVSHDRLRRVLARMLDESEFLSPYGIRSLSRVHPVTHPYTCG